MTVAEIFIDGQQAASSLGKTGAATSTGPRVGPAILEEILCDGKIRVIVTNGVHPVASTDLGAAISYVLRRDQGQRSIEGCHSRYRLQAQCSLTSHADIST